MKKFGQIETRGLEYALPKNMIYVSDGGFSEKNN
jgi:hypothetical protein